MREWGIMRQLPRYEFQYQLGRESVKSTFQSTFKRQTKKMAKRSHGANEKGYL